jgi:hypothetical protein
MSQSPSLKKISSLINLNGLKKQQQPSPTTHDNEQQNHLHQDATTQQQQQSMNESALQQFIATQQLLFEEQLLITQEKQNIVNTVQSINSSMLTIPLLLLNIRTMNQKIYELSGPSEDESQNKESPRRSSISSSAPKALNMVLTSPSTVISRFTSAYMTQSPQSQSIVPPLSHHYDESRNKRLYKLNDKDHPLGTMKLNYEAIVNYIRLDPILFARCCREIVKSQQYNSENVSQNVAKQDSNRLAEIVIYSLYGNHNNSLESICIVSFLKEVINIAFEYCQKPTDILKNHFIRELLTSFMKREGLEYFRFLHSEALFELLQNDDFDVRVENTRPEPPAEPPVRKSHERRSSLLASFSPITPPTTPNVFEAPRSLDEQTSNKSNEEVIKEEYERRMRSSK